MESLLIAKGDDEVFGGFAVNLYLANTLPKPDNEIMCFGGCSAQTDNPLQHLLFDLRLDECITKGIQKG